MVVPLVEVVHGQPVEVIFIFVGKVGIETSSPSGGLQIDMGYTGINADVPANNAIILT